MKAIIILGLIAIAAAAPTDVKLIQQQETRDDHGQFAYNFLSEDGVSRTEQGRLAVNKEGTQNVFVTRGAYRYTAPDGQIVETHYTAGKYFNDKNCNIDLDDFHSFLSLDENGFRVTGTHVPVGPTA
jgi:hypothetical protein